MSPRIIVAEPFSIRGRRHLNERPVLGFRRARADETALVLDILAEAAAWLHNRGIHQWPERFPAESTRSQIEARTLMLAEAGPVVATFVMVRNGDYWTDGHKALHVSRLAVRRSAAGQGVGYRILDWVQARARIAGMSRIRLATARDNLALRAYYEAAGFRHVADPQDAKWPTSLYERIHGYR
ncbi:GNAT family N-acetyltransferase [Nocardia sp. NPDC051052]|uniref:GNAT family N-acetyltransferase n=1 Tax=Nocardia sp. NPDC051052 TaxID=3364322 RepID=UPI0037B4EF63